MPTFWAPSALHDSTLAVLPFMVATLEGEHTPSAPTLGGPNTGSTVGVALLGSPGENITKLSTILPLCYHALLRHENMERHSQ